MAQEQEDIDLGRFTAGGTDRFRATIKKDGVAWDLSAGSVEITFEAPDRETTHTRAMVAENAAGGIFYYDTTVDEWEDVGSSPHYGYWTAKVTVTDGAVVKPFACEIGFVVAPRP